MPEEATPSKSLLQGEPWPDWAESLTVAAVSFLLAWWYFNDRISLWAALGLLALSLAVQVVGVLFHELSHVAVGATVGYRIFALRLGAGKLLTQRRIRSTVVSIRCRLVPLGGATYGYPTSVSVGRADAVCYSLAGPFAQLLLLAVALVFVDGLPSVIAAVTAAGGAIGSLMIYPSQIEGSGPTSDGTKAVRRIRESRQTRLDRLDRYPAMESMSRLARGDWDGSIAWGLKALELNPDDMRARSAVAGALVASDKFEQGRRHAKIAIKSLSKDDVLLRATVLNTLAWADLMIQGPGDLEEALATSAEAYELRPSPPIAGTRAYALIESGAVAEGMQLLWSLNPLSDGTYPEHDRAITAAILAIGAARLGDPAASTFLARAAELGPDLIVYPRAQEEVTRRALPT